MSEDQIHGSHVLRAWCNTSVNQHVARFPAEANRLASLRKLLSVNTTALHDRRTLPGHVTATGVIVDLASRRVLLIRHKVLDRWLPPGGHLEVGELPPAAALREAIEETGLTSLTPWGEGPVDIDTHPIPANPVRGEPAHEHHDFRFVFTADPDEPLRPDAGEVSAAAWVSWDDPRVPANLAVALVKVDAMSALNVSPVSEPDR
jgi:8-oxo-dGTP pyrophosphatase MutT (NUDIX family)